jgi:UDP-N-acetylmuramate dehydrogenase
VFKNPSEKVSAGMLIDKAGLKGTAVGGAVVSERHANFIVNRGGATASDVLRLIELIRDRVRKEHNVTLELEVEVW